MSAHAQLSPSRAHRWMACPGSIREEAKYPETTGPAAIDGTHTHTLLELCIKDDLADPSKYVGMALTDHEGEFVVDMERARRVLVAIEYIRNQVKEYNGLFTILPEQRVDPAHLIGRTDMAGTVDVQIFGGDTIELIDYKDGMGVVEVIDNPQLMQYALGVLASFKLPINVEYPYKRVRMTVIQPKLAVKNINPISSYELPVSAILNKIGHVVVAAKATDDPDAPLVPGDSQCKFCRAKGSCAALAGNVMREVGIMFQPTVQSFDIAQQAANKDPATMDDQQIRQIMEAAPLMRQLLDGVEEEALRRLKAGVSIPGLKLVNGKGSRVWSLSENEIAEKLIGMGVPKTSVYETKLVSPAKAEKLVWKKRDGTEKQLTERQLKTLDQEYVSKIAGKLTVVSESDSRPAVVLNAAPMFGAVELQPVEALPAWLS